MKLAEGLKCSLGIPDEDILKLIKFQIGKYASLSRQQSLTKAYSKKKGHRCSSVTMASHSNDRVHTEETEPSRYYSEKRRIGQDIDIDFTIESVFKKLIQAYSGTTWCKEEPRPQIHIVALKQFWLDCYMCDSNSMELLMDSLPNKIWINVEGFFKTVETATKTSSYTIFSFKRYDKKLQTNFLIKKLLCN